MRQGWYIATIAKDAAKLGAKYGIGLELDQFCLAENMEEPAFSRTDREVRQQIREASNPPLLLHAPFNELAPAAIDRQIREIAYQRYEQAYQVAKGYGIKKMIVHSGYVPLIYYKAWHHEKSVAFWKRYMADKPDDFTICIENVMEDEPGMMAEIAKEVDRPNVQLCLDVGHANCCGRIPLSEWLRVMGPYLGHLHLHNNNGERDQHGPVREGTIDMAQVLDNIGKAGRPDLTITIESIDGKASLEWLDQQGYLK